MSRSQSDGFQSDGDQNAGRSSSRDAGMQIVAQALAGLRYGQVTIIVQDGRIVQIDRTERTRLTALESS